MNPAVWRDWIARGGTWRRRGVAFGAGAASVLALAPFFFWPILFLTLPILVWLIDKPTEPALSTTRRFLVNAAGAGWWFGFGYFMLGLFWIGEAFLVEADKFAWALPFAVTLMPAGLALFYALATTAAALLWRPGSARIVWLAMALAGTEWLRGHVLTGFPWNVLGYALTSPLSLMQSAALTGIYGLTLWGVIIFAAPLVLAADRAAATWRAWRAPITCAALPMLALFVFGFWQLARPPAPAAPDIRLRIVQPSVPQREKWLPQNQRAIFDQHLQMSRRNAAGEDVGLAGITHVIWPEAAMPFLPLERPEATSAIAELIAPSGSYLIAGGLRRETLSISGPPTEQAAAGPQMNYFNSLLVFGPEQTSVYDKIHLVPFGEYLPLKGLLEMTGLGGMARMRGGFTAGPTPRPLLDAGSLRQFSPLICYEAVFPGAIVQGEERPSLLLNVTNDGWFGNTTGPRQHLHQARVRAVEEGVPLVRAANNGISAMIDADGRVLQSLPMNAVGVIETQLPAIRPETPYARYGDGLFAVNLLIFGLVGLYLTRRNKMPSR